MPRGKALESAKLAPGNLNTLRALTNPERRPSRPREVPPLELLNRIPEVSFQLDEERFAKNVRSARRGAAAGPSGMTSEHLFPMLENDGDLQALTEFASMMARDVPPQAKEVLRLGRMSALQKPDGGVRGIVVGDTFRRVVARTIAQQVAEAAEEATAPFQYALRTRAGTECVSHIMQSLTDLDPRTTILSVDGVGAFDLISRNSMMEGLFHMEGGEKLLPFVRMFYSTPSTFLWEDEEGTVHHIPQGEGGEQGDPLMPMLFTLGQHSSLIAVSDRLHHGERLCAFLDDLYVASNPERTVDCHQILGEELWHHAKIRLHHGKTAVWNRGGEVPPDIGALERAARITDPSARVWRGGIHSVPEERGITILGVPVGTPEFVVSARSQSRGAPSIAAEDPGHQGPSMRLVGLVVLRRGEGEFLHPDDQPQFVPRIRHPT